MRANLMRKQSRFVGRIRIGALALLVVSVAAGAMLSSACQPADPASAPSEEAAPAPAMKSAPVAKTVSPAKRAAPARSPTIKAPVPAGREASGPVAKAVSTPSTATVPVSTATARELTVTITGCLARKDQAFRLKDARGDDAPKSRSWKTGFLRKRSADVAVIDAANRLRLSNYVGQRVALTGTLDDREMHARSLVAVSRSCN